MIGHLDKATFNPEENYNDFYAGHKFEPLSEEIALNADEIIPRVAWALDVAQEIGAQNVLDLCCLDGFASLTLAHKLGIGAMGIDLSLPGVELARERAEANNLSAHYIQSSIEDIQVGLIPQFDLVLLFEAIEHFTDVDKVMSVIKQHLKPGGTLLVSTPDAEGVFGIGNDDACHLRIYSHRTAELPKNTHDDKPIISLPGYLVSQGFNVTDTQVWNDLVHCRATLA